MWRKGHLPVIRQQGTVLSGHPELRNGVRRTDSAEARAQRNLIPSEAGMLAEPIDRNSGPQILAEKRVDELKRVPSIGERCV